MEFKFFEHFKDLANMKNIMAGNKQLNKLCKEKSCNENEICLGNRQVGERSYHIFYFVAEEKFSLYYHGGGTDAMYSTDSLDIMLAHVNSLNE